MNNDSLHVTGMVYGANLSSLIALLEPKLYFIIKGKSDQIKNPIVV